MGKKRAVITGMGSISCIGNNLNEISKSLKEGTSGIFFNEEYENLGFRSKVSGSINIDLKELIDRKLLRFMGEAASYSYLSALEAIKDANLPKSIFDTDRIGVIAGSGGASSRSQVDAADIMRNKGVKRIGPYRVTQTMGSTVSACLSTSLKIKGVNFSISSACSTSAHCIGSAWEQIQLGNQDVVIAGGGEDEHWTQSGLFDAMGALSSNFNNDPTKASRPFDENRDGFVISGGGGIVIVEELEHALRRDAEIYAEDDKKRRETVETRNQAEALTHTANKTLSDLGDKADEELQTEVKTAIADVNSALEGEDETLIKEKTEALSTVMMKLGEVAYSAESADSDAQPGSDQHKDETSEEVVDAEFEEIDDQDEDIKKAN